MPRVGGCCRRLGWWRAQDGPCLDALVGRTGRLNGGLLPSGHVRREWLTAERQERGSRADTRMGDGAVPAGNCSRRCPKLAPGTAPSRGRGGGWGPRAGVGRGPRRRLVEIRDRRSGTAWSGAHACRTAGRRRLLVGPRVGEVPRRRSSAGLCSCGCSASGQSPVEAGSSIGSVQGRAHSTVRTMARGPRIGAGVVAVPRHAVLARVVCGLLAGALPLIGAVALRLAVPAAAR